MSNRPEVTGFYHEDTFSIAYVVADPKTRRAAIIDPVLDYDERAGRVSSRFASVMLDFIKAEGLTVEWILDTHPHADHLTAAHYLKEQLSAPIATGEHVKDVAALWRDIYNLPELPVDGSPFDRLLADGDRFSIGELEVRVMHSPGHTLASITYMIGDAAFVHDTLFQPDFGTARTDFPGGSGEQLYHSIAAILALPDETRLFTGHDYRPGGREARWESTVAEQKRSNIHLKAAPSEAEFILLRQKRDAELTMPRLILHALQVNLMGGQLPKPEANGRSYLKIPIGAL